MSLDAALLAARSGLLHTQRALAASADNVANAETPGHTRKTVAARAAHVDGQGIGIRTLPPSRDVDAALVTELDRGRASAAAASLREWVLRGIETAHGSPAANDGLGDLVARLRGGFEDLRATPAEPARQAALVIEAETLAARFNQVSAAIGAARQQAQDGIVAEVGLINDTLREIAALTDDIRDRVAQRDSAATIEDRRDAAIARLSESIEARALKREDGGIVLVARNGIVLPIDPVRDAFSTADAVIGPDVFHGPGGTLPGIMLGGRDVTGLIRGGRLAEHVALRDATLPRYKAEVDLAAAHLAARLDAQGLALFTDATGAVPDVTQPYAASAMLGFAGVMRVNPAVSVNPTLVRDGTHDVTGNPLGASDFTRNPPGGPASFATLLDRVIDFGFGTEARAASPWAAIPTAGLGPDGLLASPFGAALTIEGYAGLVTAAHTADRATASARADTAKTLVQGLEARFSQRSGVDVDAEMAAMVTLQNAYAANARIMSTVQAMWDALFGAVR